MDKGKIIYLNGVSASGKSTLSRTLQQRLNEPFYWLPLDIFYSQMAPAKIYNIKGFSQADFEIFSLLLYTVKSYSDNGINTIVDVVHTRNDKTQGNEIFVEAIKLLHDYPVLFVNVTCPADELHRRKTVRGDAEVDKWLPHQLEHFVPKEPYDITVDTYSNTSEECADEIIELLDNPEKLTAFKTLWSQHTEKYQCEPAFMPK